MILIDLNDFKRIYDSFGHNVGDEALRNSLKIIRSRLRKEDFIAWYDGDEFYVILELNDPRVLKSTAYHINHVILKFNFDSNQPYKLSFCMGYDVYDSEDKLSADNSLKHIEALMYRNKEAMKNNN